MLTPKYTWGNLGKTESKAEPTEDDLELKKFTNERMKKGIPDIDEELPKGFTRQEVEEANLLKKLSDQIKNMELSENNDLNHEPIQHNKNKNKPK